MIIEKISPNNREKAMALVLSVFMRYEFLIIQSRVFKLLETL